MKIKRQKQYVTQQDLDRVKKAGVYPCDIQKSRWQFLVFGSVGVTYVVLTRSGEKTKHVNYWQTMTADELNAKFAALPWE